MKTIHRIMFGDSRNMESVDNESIHLIVTSPPYWQLKDYGNHKQIGFNDTYEEYINNLNLVWNECYRVLHPGCRMIINIGDQFARSVYYGRYKVIPIRTEIIKFAETIGFDYLGAIIWQKKTTMNTTGGASVMGSYPYPRNGIVEIDYEFNLILKKHGKVHCPTKEQKELSRLTKEEWKEYFSGHWNFGGAKQDKHLAMFPEELPKRFIKMFTFVGETVLDPFVGSGTTSLAAKKFGRNSIGYEINKDFLPIIKERLEFDKVSIFNEEFVFKNEKIKDINYQEKIEKLPYLFKDKVKFDKKVDPQKINFGSKISSNDKSQTDEYFTVKKIVSPTELILSNDLYIKLLGIKAIKDREGEAINFLEKKFKGNKIFLKFDEVKFDADNRLLTYVYLKNKTLINAHLLKNGLAEVEDGYNFRFKKKFNEYYWNIVNGK